MSATRLFVDLRTRYLKIRPRRACLDVVIRGLATQVHVIPVRIVVQ